MCVVEFILLLVVGDGVGSSIWHQLHNTFVVAIICNTGFLGELTSSTLLGQCVYDFMGPAS